METIVDLLSSLSLSTGFFKSSKDSDEVVNSKIVFQLLESFNGKLSSVSGFTDSSLKLLPAGEDETLVDASLLGVISRLSDKKPRLSAARLAIIGDVLLQQVYASDLSAVYDSLQSITELNKYKISPIVIKLEKNVLPINTINEEKLKIEIFDLFGDAVNYNNIEVKSLTYNNNDDSIYRSATSTGEIDLSSLNLSIGRYELELVVTMPDRTQGIPIKKFFVVTNELVLSNIAAGVTDSKQVSISDLQPINRINGLTDLNVIGSALENEVLHVSFTLKSAFPNNGKFYKPNQTVIKLESKSTGLIKIFPAKSLNSASNDNSNVYKASISLADELNTLHHTSGLFEVTILIGDVAYSNPISYVVGTVEFKLPAIQVVNDLPLYKLSLLDTSDNTLTALPEITHQMRPDAKRASPIISTIFTGFVFLPLIALIIYTFAQKPNFKRFKSIGSVLFVLSFGSILALYLGYWFGIPGFSFYQTIKYLILLFPVTYFTGRLSLASVIELRLKENESQNKKHE